MKVRFLEKGVQFYNLLKVQLTKIQDPNFNAFVKYEEEQSLDKINSKEKLAYLKMLDLSKQGFINPERKKFFKQERELYKLMDVDQNIKMVGQINVNKGNKLDKQLIVGYNSKTNKLLMSDSHIKNIPIWKKASTKLIQEVFSSITPGIDQSRENKLDFDHQLFNDDMEDLKEAVKANLSVEFHKIADIAMRSNKYIRNAFPTLPDDFSQNVKQYKDFKFKVPASFFPQLKAKSEYIVATFQDANENQYLFKPLIKTGPSNFYPVEKAFLENKINERNVTLLGKINANVAVGYNNKDGATHIGVRDRNSGYLWKPYEHIMKNELLQARDKEIITNIIDTKNFLVEKDKIVMKNQKNANQTLIIKKHYSKPGLYFLEKTKDDKPHTINSFKKMDAHDAKLISKKYENTPGIKAFKKLAIDEKIIDKVTAKQIFKDLASAAASVSQHR